MKASKTVAVIALSVCLASCGGGDSEEAAATQTATAAPASTNTVAPAAIATDTTATTTDQTTTSAGYGDLTKIYKKTEATAQAAVKQSQDSRAAEAQTQP